MRTRSPWNAFIPVVKTKMASPNVIVANHEPVRLDFGCGISTVTVRTAKRIIIAGWVFIVLGIVLIGFGIAAIIARLKFCDDFCGNSDPKQCICFLNYSRIVGFFLSAVLSNVGGVVATRRSHAAIEALRKSKMNAPNRPVYPVVLRPQQTAYGSI
ncbi:unnamed protein product [Darwinula stevensoni]|uniref:Transmembrane protein n=1 Tax=Darwinula stevensoni TaxID=69355 RepID=A0A7R9AGD5_9CRUS|nr:unnamed protein product [Darwinula stevensoni]CAG0903754.1 unnamed protein product [Darwinula stevensoni]